MHVQVKDGLTGGGAGIYADVVAVGAVPGIEDLLDHEGQFAECVKLRGGGLARSGYLPVGDP